MKTKGCVWCDMRRKGSWAVKESRDTHRHYVCIDTRKGCPIWAYKPCQKFEPTTTKEEK